MSGAGVPEKILRQSQSIRCLENVRRDDEVLERGVSVAVMDAP